MSPLRRFWPVLAIAAGALLIYFEVGRGRAIEGDNIFWIIVGGLIIVLAAIDLIQKARGGDAGDGGDGGGGKMLGD